MIFLFIMNWVQFWFHIVFMKTVVNPYFYYLFVSWIIGFYAMTMMFFYNIDHHRLLHVFRQIFWITVQTAMYGFIITMLLIALYDMSSKFFIKQKTGLSQISCFGVFGHTYGQSLKIIQKIMTNFFLFFNVLLQIFHISQISYHLQNQKYYRIYVGLSIALTISYYAIFRFLECI